MHTKHIHTRTYQKPKRKKPKEKVKFACNKYVRIMNNKAEWWVVPAASYTYTQTDSTTKQKSVSTRAVIKRVQ